MAREVRTGRKSAAREFGERMKYAARLVAARNQRLGRPLDDAELEDVVQEAVVLIWTKLDSYEGRAALETWIYPFCVNVLANAIRKKLRRTAKIATSATDPDERCGPRDAPQRADESVLRALAMLGPPADEVIRLKIYDSLTFQEIARRLAIPSETAKTWYYRGLERLRQTLSPKPDPMTS